MLREKSSMRNRVHCLFLAIVAITLGLQPVQITADPVLLIQTGKASYYGKRFHGKKTASGKRFDQQALVAAHPSWPFGTLVRVTNNKNGRSVKVSIVDRGPAKKARRRGILSIHCVRSWISSCGVSSLMLYGEGRMTPGGHP